MRDRPGAGLRFAVGDAVVERVGDQGPDRFDQVVLVVDADAGAGTVTVESGRVYDALSGGRVPANSRPYRSIRSVAYRDL